MSIPSPRGPDAAGPRSPDPDARPTAARSGLGLRAGRACLGLAVLITAACHCEPEPPPPPETLSLSFVGDIIFGRYREAGYDPIAPPGEDPFADVAASLRADMVIGNLETPIADPLPPTSPIEKKHRFAADASQLEWLVQAGFTGVDLANNHAFDLGPQAALATADLVRRAGLVPLGATRARPPALRVETVDVRGWRIAIIAATTRNNSRQPSQGPWLPYVDGTRLDVELRPLVREADPTHDLVVVMLHWGHEYEDQPRRHHVAQAHALVDAGADILVGHHGHVLQPLEPYRDGVVAYSMGNFLLENTHKIPRQTAVLRLEAARRDGRVCLRRATMVPVYMKREPWPHPVTATGGMAQRIRQRIRRLGRPLDVAYDKDGESLSWTWADCFPDEAAAG